MSAAKKIRGTASKKVASKIVKRGAKGVAGSVIGALDVLAAIKDVTAAYTDFAKVKQIELTKRTQIERERQVSLASIDAKREIILDYFKQSFAEREIAVKGYFKTADDALEAGNLDALALVVGALVELTKSGPFKDLATQSQTTLALANPEHEWKV